jgi:hypothetical protein
VPNWSISRNYKEIGNSTKISVTPGVHLTRGDSVQKPLTYEPHGWPASQSPWSVGPTLQHLTGCLGSDALQETVIRNLRPTVRGGRATWSADHVARPAGQHLVCYRLNQVSNSSWDSYKYPPYRWNSTHHILHVVLHL